jgi:hypothetical protein
VIYIRVGFEIYEKRRQLRVMSGQGGTANSVSVDPEPFTGIRTTEIEVTHGDAYNKIGVDPLERAFSPREKNLNRDQYSITITAPPNVSPTPRAGTFAKRQPNSMDRVKWAYTKCAILFAVSILITWVPASINRIYGLIYPVDPSFALNVGSAIVLPLQGFWNTVIYFMTSWSICKKAWSRWRASRTARVVSGPAARNIGPSSNLVNGKTFKLGEVRHPGTGMKAKDSDSTVELSSSVSGRSTSL